MLKDKLNPRTLGFSPKIAYILQAVTGFDYGVRDGKGGYAASLSITSDGYMIAATSSRESGAFLGDAGDLQRNLSALLNEAKLSPAERSEFDKLYASHVMDWRN